MPEAPLSAPRPWSEGRILLWFILLLMAGAVFGPPFVSAFRPPPKLASDFLQEWLSAKNYRIGRPAYESQREIVQVHLILSPERAANALPWNAHPPVAVLLTLPFGHLDYRDAHTAWNLINLPLFIFGLVLVIRTLSLPFVSASILPTLVLALACYPLYSQVQQGQFNILLMVLLAVAWSRDQRGDSIGVGMALGTAAALKLFPAFLFLPLLVRRDWRALAAGSFAFLFLNGLALLVLGPGDFGIYIREVVPSLTSFQSSRQNVSLAGFWLRLFDPHPNEHVLAAVRLPALAAIGSYGSRAAVVALVCWRVATARTRFEHDRAWAIATFGMLLVSPIAWPHYFLMLAMPLGWLWQNLAGRPRRYLFGITCFVLWLPNYYFPSLVLGPEVGMVQFLQGKSDVLPRHNLALISLPHYALLGLFALALAARPPVATVPPLDAP